MKKKDKKKQKKTSKLSCVLFNSKDMLVTLLCKEEWKTKNTPSLIVKEIQLVAIYQTITWIIKLR